MHLQGSCPGHHVFPEVDGACDGVRAGGGGGAAVGATGAVGDGEDGGAGQVAERVAIGVPAVVLVGLALPDGGGDPAGMQGQGGRRPGLDVQRGGAVDGDAVAQVDGAGDGVGAGGGGGAGLALGGGAGAVRGDGEGAGAGRVAERVAVGVLACFRLGAAVPGGGGVRLGGQ